MDLLSRTPEATIQSAIDKTHKEWHDIITEAWRPTGMEDHCDLVLDVEGIPGEKPTIASNVHAQLVVCLKMSFEWGWGLFEVMDTISSGQNRIEHNGLTWCKEVFDILQREFDCAAPEFGEDVTQTPLFDALKEDFVESVGFELSDKKIEHPSLEQWQSSPFNDTFNQIIKAVIDQLITGHNKLLDPSEESQDIDTFNVEFTHDDDGLSADILINGNHHSASIIFDNTEQAEAARTNPDLKSALLWKMGEFMDSEDAIAVIERFPVEFSKQTTQFQTKYDVSSDDLAELLIHNAGGTFLSVP